ASGSTFSTRALPAMCSATFLISGATMRHGPHHAAQKSTITGTDECATTASNAAVLSMSIGSDGWGRPAWHLAHRVARSNPANGKRFVVPHDPHVTSTPLLSSV